MVAAEMPRTNTEQRSQQDAENLAQAQLPRCAAEIDPSLLFSNGKDRGEPQRWNSFAIETVHSGTILRDGAGTNGSAHPTVQAHHARLFREGTRAQYIVGSLAWNSEQPYSVYSDALRDYFRECEASWAGDVRPRDHVNASVFAAPRDRHDPALQRLLDDAASLGIVTFLDEIWHMTALDSEIARKPNRWEELCDYTNSDLRRDQPHLRAPSLVAELQEIRKLINSGHAIDWPANNQPKVWTTGENGALTRHNIAFIRMGMDHVIHYKRNLPDGSCFETITKRGPNDCGDVGKGFFYQYGWIIVTPQEGKELVACKQLGRNGDLGEVWCDAWRKNLNNDAVRQNTAERMAHAIQMGAFLRSDMANLALTWSNGHGPFLPDVMRRMNQILDEGKSYPFTLARLHARILQEQALVIGETYGKGTHEQLAQEGISPYIAWPRDHLRRTREYNPGALTHDIHHSSREFYKRALRGRINGCQIDQPHKGFGVLTDSNHDEPVAIYKDERGEARGFWSYEGAKAVIRMAMPVRSTLDRQGRMHADADQIGADYHLPFQAQAAKFAAADAAEPGFVEHMRRLARLENLDIFRHPDSHWHPVELRDTENFFHIVHIARQFNSPFFTERAIVLVDLRGNDKPIRVDLAATFPGIDLSQYAVIDMLWGKVQPAKTVIMVTPDPDKACGLNSFVLGLIPHTELVRHNLVSNLAHANRFNGRSEKATRAILDHEFGQALRYFSRDYSEY